jgi:hypothetical protein
MAEAPSPQDQPLRELRGVVGRITYQHAENGFTVAGLSPERPEAEAQADVGDDRLVTGVGTLADLTPGRAIVAHGWWRNDPKHGWQLAKAYRTALPATLLGMKTYLGSGLVNDIGPTGQAGRSRRLTLSPAVAAPDQVARSALTAAAARTAMIWLTACRRSNGFLNDATAPIRSATSATLSIAPRRMTGVSRLDRCRYASMNPRPSNPGIKKSGTIRAGSWA